MSAASIQVRVDLESVDRGVARFGTGERAHRVAVLDVTGADQSLASADDAKQEEILAGRAQFLNAQLADFQLLVRAEPVDLDGHLGRVQDRARELPETLAALARDYVVFLQTLAHQRTLLERRCYVVVPAALGRAAVPLRRGLGSVLGRLTRRGGASEARDEATVDAEIARRLGARCDEVSHQLGRSGLRTRRLDGPAYAQLYHRCWAPALARTQRFRRDIAEYTALVVRGVRSAGRRAAHSAEDDEGDREGGAGRLLPTSGDRLSRDEHLLALGSRTLADLVAPGGCEVRTDHLRLEGQYARVLAVTAYPRTVTPGWLAPLVEGDLPIELSVHVRPLQSAEMVRALGVQIARLQSSRLAALRGDRVADPEREIALEDAERLRDQLQRGEERVFSTSLYILVRGSGRAELDELTRRVELVLDGMLAHSRRAFWEQERGLRSCLPEGRDQLLVPRNLNTSALAATLPFVGSSLSMERGVLYGVSPRTQTPIIIDPFDESLDNANLAVVAPAGTGKSFFVKLMALRNLINGTDFVVIDPEDEYRAVAYAVGGQVVRLAASSPHRLNPFDLPPAAPPLPIAAAGPGWRAGGEDDEADPLAEQVTALLGLLEVMLCAGSGPGGAPGTLDPYERAVLDRALYQTYARQWQDRDGRRGGITRDDPSSYTKSAPLLRDLHAVLLESPGEVAASLAARLERYVSGSLAMGLFSGPTNVTLDRPFVVFQIRDLAEELRPLAIHLIAGFVWNRVRRSRRPRQLIVDEAAALLAHPEGGAFLARMARRARKYYLGLVTISQKVADLTDCEHGDTILTNSDMVLLLKQKAEIIEAADARFRLTQEERQLLLGADKGEGLLFVRGNRVPIQIVPSPAERRLATTNPRELERLAAATPDSPTPASREPAPRNGGLSVGAALAARRAGAGVQNGRAGPAGRAAQESAA